MSRVKLLHGEQDLLHEYNNHVAKKLNEKSPETITTSTLSVGFTRGIRQLREDIEVYDPFNSYFDLPIGGLFDTKKDFYRLISLLLTDLGLVLDIRFPSPWQVISELQNQDIIIESDSSNLKVCLSIANEIRLKTYFANGGQKELFSPLPQSPNSTEQSTNDPIFREFDEDTLVRLLSTSYDMHRRCQEFCFMYARQGKPDVSILRNPFFPLKDWVMSTLYTRLQNFPKALECLKSISKNSPEYARCVSVRGQLHAIKEEWEKATECFETALEYSQNPVNSLSYHRDVANSLIQCHQFKKAKNQLEKAMKLHDEIYGEGSETIVLSQLMLELGTADDGLDDFPSAIKTYQRVEYMQKRITRCSDMNVINLNIDMAFSYSRLSQNNDQALDYLKRALCISHKIFGKHDLSCELLKIYQNAAVVYRNCGRYHEASLMLERCLKLTESLHGDTPNSGKIVKVEEKWQ